MNKIATILIAAFISTNANAIENNQPSPLPQLVQANILTVNLDPQVYFYDESIQSGVVTIDENSNEIQLTLYRGNHCPPGRWCTLEKREDAPAPVVIQLPIVSRTFGFCGAEVIVAREDATPVDGPLQEITVVNNSLSKCLSIWAPAMTEIEFRDLYPRTNHQTRSTFTADKLKRLGFFHQ